MQARDKPLFFPSTKRITTLFPNQDRPGGCLARLSIVGTLGRRENDRELRREDEKTDEDFFPVGINR